MPRQCDSAPAGVRCTRAAELQVGFEVFALVDTSVGAPARLMLFVCRPCGAETVLEDVISDEGWAQVVAMLVANGKAEPDRALTKLRLFDEWVILGR